MNIYENRRGIFSVSAYLIEHEPFIVRCLMSRCVIVKAEYIHMHDAVEYSAYSLEFDELEHGDPIPIYRVVIDSDAGFFFERIEQCHLSA